MREFTPDYRHILDAAFNREAARLPLYEHNVSPSVIEKITGKQFFHLFQHPEKDRDYQEFFSHYCGFFQDYGYDAVTFECCITGIYPGGGALGNSGIDPAIHDRADFEKYPWDSLCDRFFAAYAPQLEALRAQMPKSMKAIGGVGNGVFECVQDLTGFENLCYLAADDPDLYEEMFEKVTQTNLAIWERFMREYGDMYCVLRFGDDLGYKSSTMLTPSDVKELIIPKYRRFTDLVHSYQKPFLLHSCGNIFHVMEDLITVANIDAKHSNEDQIALFPKWVEDYGSRIGNFGGIDTDAVCRLSKPEMKDYITEVVAKCQGHGGFAFGSGNSIPDYVPAENYLTMIEILRELRGDYQ